MQIRLTLEQAKEQERQALYVLIAYQSLLYVARCRCLWVWSGYNDIHMTGCSVNTALRVLTIVAVCDHITCTAWQRHYARTTHVDVDVYMYMMKNNQQFMCVNCTDDMALLDWLDSDDTLDNFCSLSWNTDPTTDLVHKSNDATAYRVTACVFHHHHHQHHQHHVASRSRSVYNDVTQTQ